MLIGMYSVPVDYTLLVEVLQAQQDLGGVEAGPLLAERLVPLQEIEHLVLMKRYVSLNM